VLLYAGGAALLLMPEDWWRTAKAGLWMRGGIAAAFLSALIVQALPGFGWWGPALPGYVQSMAEMPQPQPFSAPLYETARLLTLSTTSANAAIVLGLALCAATFIFWPQNRALFWFSIVWTFLGWWLGQDFGVLGGMGTDPNLGAILLVAIFVYGDRAGLVMLPHRRASARNNAALHNHPESTLGDDLS
jgi:hypothetical protein